ncbi:hypothetical protein E3P84_03448 [Wallemia ichthyophaga]|nr:hypothetical protein E3P84_03448 [Wallemia ichthyophaga]TIB39711.1 hypothetical protein E3P83_03348 [Wallemia ichthyophaga]
MVAGFVKHIQGKARDTCSSDAAAVFKRPTLTFFAVRRIGGLISLISLIQLPDLEEIPEVSLSVTPRLSLSFPQFVLTSITKTSKEVKSRGQRYLQSQPKGTPIVFVAAPHHNQFLDALLLSSEVLRASNRKLSFLTADKSMNRFFIGHMARAMESIPVKRAADAAKPGVGTIYMTHSAPTNHLFGIGTQFTHQVSPKMSIALSSSLGGASAEVVEIINDTHLILKNDLGKPQAINALKAVNPATTSQAIKYKVLPFINQEVMYKAVYDKLRDGGSIGIFPEGGSHDRSDLLPLKAGVSVMALGAMAANPDLQVKIVPVGLSYFHAHKFRSRAVIEFGDARAVPRDLVDLFTQGGADKRAACASLLDIIYDGLKSVTVQAPDYETLMVIQAGRRLFKTPGHHLTLGQVVELNRRLIAGYLSYKDDVKIIALRNKILKYNRRLQDLGIRDHQVEAATRKSWKSAGLLLYRVWLLLLWGLLAFPGAMLHLPVFLTAKYISHRKAKEALANSTVKIEARDVIGSWKVLVSLALIPLLYLYYVVLTTYIATRYGSQIGLSEFYIRWSPLFALLSLPYLGISALKFGEGGVDIYKSLRPLFVNLLPWNEKELSKIKRMRQDLANELTDIIEEYGPKQMEDFEKITSVPPIPAQAHSQQSSFQWLDEMLFGWSTTKRADGGGIESESQSRGVQEDAVVDLDADSRYSMPGSFSMSGAQALSKEAPLTPVPDVLNDGDFDKVVSFLDAPSLVRENGTTSGSKSRRSSSDRNNRNQKKKDESYHPYNAANIERVRQDEEQARLSEQLETQVGRSEESKRKLDILRGRSKKGEKGEKSEQQQHPNFWQHLEQPPQSSKQSNEATAAINTDMQMVHPTPRWYDVDTSGDPSQAADAADAEDAADKSGSGSNSLKSRMKRQREDPMHDTLIKDRDDPLNDILQATAELDSAKRNKESTRSRRDKHSKHRKRDSSSLHKSKEREQSHARSRAHKV